MFHQQYKCLTSIKIDLATIKHILHAVLPKSKVSKMPTSYMALWISKHPMDKNITWRKSSDNYVKMPKRHLYLSEHFVQMVTVVKCHSQNAVHYMWTTSVNNINVPFFFFFARMHVLPSSGRSLNVHYLQLHAAIRPKAPNLPQILHINMAN